MDWQYFSLATKGYSISDLRCILNSSALNQAYSGDSTHTEQSVKRAIGMINALRDKTAYGVARVDDPRFKGLFERLATYSRQSDDADAPLTQYKIDNVYVQKKVHELLRLILDDSTQSKTTAENWAVMSTSSNQQYERDEDQQAKLIDGVLALFSEVVFFKDFQQASCSPRVFFDTYCFSLGSQLQSVYLPVYELQVMTQYVATGTFLRAFDTWETAKPPGWATLSYSPLVDLTERFYLLDTWYKQRPFRFHIKEQTTVFGRSDEFLQPTPSDPLESLQTKPRDIKAQYIEPHPLFLSATTLWTMIFTRVREQNNVYFMRRPLRAHSYDINIYRTFGTSHFFTQKEWKKVVELKQVANELITIGQLRSTARAYKSIES